MKRKNIFKIIIIILFIWVIFFITDYTLSKQNKSPIFSIKVDSYFDGGSTVYYGIGYKVIKCNTLNGDKKVYFGFYNMKYKCESNGEI